MEQAPSELIPADVPRKAKERPPAKSWFETSAGPDARLGIAGACSQRLDRPGKRAGCRTASIQHNPRATRLCCGACNSFASALAAAGLDRWTARASAKRDLGKGTRQPSPRASPVRARGPRRPPVSRAQAVPPCARAARGCRAQEAQRVDSCSGMPASAPWCVTTSSDRYSFPFHGLQRRLAQLWAPPL